jgi:hypothetical protein
MGSKGVHAMNQKKAVPSLLKLLRSLTDLQRMELAEDINTTVNYLYKLAGGHKRAGPLLAKRIAEKSGYRVTAAQLRPDIYGEEPVESQSGTSSGGSTSSGYTMAALSRC